MNSIIRKNDGLANALAKYRKGNFLILVALAAMMVLSAKSLRAATVSWDGGTSGTASSWGTAGNWAGDALPASGDDLLFQTVNGTGTSISALSMGGSRTAGWLTFDNSSSKLASTVTLDANGAGGTTARTLTVNTGVKVTNTTTTVAINGANGGISYVMGANNTFSVSSGANLNIATVISGAYSATKVGAGTMTLSGANTYSGGTTISAGTLKASNNGALGTGSVTVDSGATLSVLANITNAVANTGTVSIGAGGTLTAASLGTGALSLAGSASNNKASFVSTQSGSTLNIGNLTLNGYTSYSMDSSKSVVSSGTITLGGTGNGITLTGSSLGVGTYNLFSGTISKGSLSNGGLTLGGTGVGNQSLTLDGSQVTSGRTTFDFVSTATALKLVVGGGAWNVVWNGGDGTWDTSAANWQKDGAGSNVAFFAADNVTLSTGNTVTVDAAGVSAGALTANNASGTAILKGGNVSASSLAKSGAGALTVSNALTLAAGVTQSAGTLNAKGNLSVTASGITVSGGTANFDGTNGIAGGLTVNGGTANLNGVNTITNGGLNLSSGSAVLNGSNTVSAGGLNVTGGTLTVNSTNNISGGFTISAGTATLNSSNTITGGVNANGGLIELNQANALGSGSVALNGGTIALGVSTLTNAISVGVAGGTFSNATAATLGGAITGNNTLTKQGAGKLSITNTLGVAGTGTGLNFSEGEIYLSGANKYLTNSTINGTLTLNGVSVTTRGTTLSGTGSIIVTNSVLWTNTSAVTTINNSVDLASGSTLTITNTGTTTRNRLEFAGGIQGSGNVTTVGGGTGNSEFRLSGTSSNNGTVTIGAGTFGRILNASATNLNFVNNGSLLFSNEVGFNNVYNGAISGNNSTELKVDGAGRTTLAGNITGLNPLVMAASGALTLSGNNSFNGIHISGSGGIDITRAAALGDSTKTITNVVSSGRISIASSAGTGNDWTIAHGVNAGASATDVMAFGPGSGNILRLSGLVSGSGQLKVTGGGDLYIANTGNTYTGGTEIGTGRIFVADDNVLGANTGAVNFGTQTNSYFVSTASGSFSASRNFTIGSATLNGYTANFDIGAGISNNVRGVVANRAGNAQGGHLTKWGAGVLTLSATNSYTGATAVEDGTLNITGDITSSSGSTVKAAAALLVGSGGKVGAVTSSGTTTISSGATAGALTVTAGTTTVGGTAGAVTSSGTTTVSSGGTVGALTLNGGTSTVNGTAGNTTVNNGATLKGSGTVAALEIASGGTLAVGNSPGTLTASSATWNGGGTYAWEINNFLGSAGSAYDFLNITGGLTISASSGNKFIIDVISLLASNNTAGEASNFDAWSNYSFAIATAAGGISGFDAAYFDIQSGKFANNMLPSGATGSGSWSISQNGNSINLNYAAAIPEPSTSGLFLAGLGIVAAIRRRKIS